MPTLRENIEIFLLYVVLTIISLHTSNVPYYVINWFIDLSTQVIPLVVATSMVITEIMILCHAV